ncbi:alpha/beta hydrolase family protein [Marinactinospora rubrisoli]|uniref:Alpha/beta hydrolase family protein n=1 Tax=Marinactinospora rubrisoli TaxID=2715399 RepID=A0ABW2KPF4_9ACTN
MPKTHHAAALAAGLAFVLPLAAPAAADGVPAEPAGFRFTLPQPTGRYQVGTTELRLVDADRADQWGQDGPREFMVSIWYPARATGETERAGYMPQEVGEIFGASLRLGPGAVDYAGSPTSAVPDAPALQRGKRPIVLYSPGGGSPRATGTTLVEELASHGYVVVTMDHTGEAPVRFPDGRIEEPYYDGEAPDLYSRLMTDRVADSRFVLDHLEEVREENARDADGRRVPRGLGAILDLSRVGMFGHSMGGSAAAHTMYQDERVDAGADLDGSISFTEDGGAFEERFPVAREGLDRPFLLMGGSGVGDTGEIEPHTHRSWDDWRRFWDNSTGWRLDVNFPEARHFSFADHQVLLPQLAEEFDVPDEAVAGTIGTADDPDRLHASERAYVVAFFDEMLLGRPQPLLDAESPEHPDARFVD